MDATGGNERKLLQQPLAGSQLAPAWSPDGKLIAFASNHEAGSVSPDYHVYTAWVTGAHVVRRTFGVMHSRLPGWIGRP